MHMSGLGTTSSRGALIHILRFESVSRTKPTASSLLILAVLARVRARALTNKLCTHYYALQMRRWHVASGILAVSVFLGSAHGPKTRARLLLVTLLSVKHSAKNVDVQSSVQACGRAALNPPVHVQRVEVSEHGVHHWANERVFVVASRARVPGILEQSPPRRFFISFRLVPVPRPLTHSRARAGSPLPFRTELRRSRIDERRPSFSGGCSKRR